MDFSTLGSGSGSGGSEGGGPPTAGRRRSASCRSPRSSSQCVTSSVASASQSRWWRRIHSSAATRSPCRRQHPPRLPVHGPLGPPGPARHPRLQLPPKDFLFQPTLFVFHGPRVRDGNGADFLELVMGAVIPTAESFSPSCPALIMPALSIGNVGQLVVDLQISSARARRVAYIDEPSVLPCAGNDAFGPDAVGDLALVVETYESTSHRLAFIQQRSSVITVIVEKVGILMPLRLIRNMLGCHSI